MSEYRHDNTYDSGTNRGNNRGRSRQRANNRKRPFKGSRQDSFNYENRFTKFRDSPRGSRRHPPRGRMGSEVSRNYRSYEYDDYPARQNQIQHFEDVPNEDPRTVPQSLMDSTDNNQTNLEKNSNIALNIKTESQNALHKAIDKPQTPMSSDGESEDSTIQRLRNAVNTNILSSNSTEPPKNISIKKEVEKKISSSSSSSSDSDTSDSSSNDNTNINKQQIEKDVICLGNMENIQNLVEDDDSNKIDRCLLCDKTDHISFRCQMICKNCNGRYHGLKECSKPANISVMLSSFIQFCMKQCYKYNPNERFDNCEQLTLSQADTAKIQSNDNTSRKKSTKKRKTSTESSSTSDTDTTARKRKRRKSTKYPGIAPYTSFTPSFGFNPSNVVNPLIAISQMMGYNANMGYPNTQ